MTTNATATNSNTTTNTPKHDDRAAYVTRADVLQFLSDAEIASVSTAETAKQLADGDEFLDLTALDRGVRTVSGRSIPIPMGHVLPRKAVHADSWAKIVALLAKGPAAVIDRSPAAVIERTPG